MGGFARPGRSQPTATATAVEIVPQLGASWQLRRTDDEAHRLGKWVEPTWGVNRLVAGFDGGLFGSLSCHANSVETSNFDGSLGIDHV